MKKIKFYALVLASVFVLFSILPATVVNAVNSDDIYFQCDIMGLMAGAFTPRLTTSPADGVPVYISSVSGFSSYVPYVLDSISAWNSTTYHIDLQRTTQYATSVIDFKGKNITDQTNAHYNSYGYCIVYCGTGAYGVNHSYENYADIPSDYWNVEIYINQTMIPASNLNTSNGRHIIRHVTAHELGHAMGLGHRMSNYNLMYPYLNPGLPSFASIPETPSNNTDKYYVRTLYDN